MKFEIGDVIKFTSGSHVEYGVLVDIEGSDERYAGGAIADNRRYWVYWLENKQELYFTRFNLDEVEVISR